MTFLLVPGCLDVARPAEGVDHGGGTFDVGGPPADAGQWNGTTLSMRVSDVGSAAVRFVRGVSAGEQDCRSFFRTEGNVSEPWAIGWALGAFSMGSRARSFSHTFVEADGINAEVADTGAPGGVGGSYPTPTHGQSSSQFGTFHEGDEIAYWFAASYPPAADDAAGGWMHIEVSCPAGFIGLETGWSTSAHLLSDVSMNGTWASVDVEETEAFGGLARARWGATPQAEWTARLPPGTTTFVATEPVAGRAVLSSGSGEHTCGPATDPVALEGDAFCWHDFAGGETALRISQAAPGSYGQSGTADTWMGLLAQMESYSWPDA